VSFSYLFGGTSGGNAPTYRDARVSCERGPSMSADRASIARYRVTVLADVCDPATTVCSNTAAGCACASGNNYVNTAVSPRVCARTSGPGQCDAAPLLMHLPSVNPSPPAITCTNPNGASDTVNNVDWPAATVNAGTVVTGACRSGFQAAAAPTMTCTGQTTAPFTSTVATGSLVVSANCICTRSRCAAPRRLSSHVRPRTHMTVIMAAGGQRVRRVPRAASVRAAPARRTRAGRGGGGGEGVGGGVALWHAAHTLCVGGTDSCPVDQFSTASGSPACTTCASVGTGLSTNGQTGQVTCACAVGGTTTTTGGFYGNGLTGTSAQCTACPAGSYQPTFNVTAASCACLVDFYNTAGAGTAIAASPCTACPAGSSTLTQTRQATCTCTAGGNATAVGGFYSNGLTGASLACAGASVVVQRDAVGSCHWHVYV
jgi:hypothetical protein